MASQRVSEMAPDLTPPPLTQLRYTWAFAHAGEYVQVVLTLASISPAAPLIKTIATFRHLHPLIEVDLPPFVDDFHPKMDCVLDKEAFIFTLTHSPHLSFDGPSGVVFELWRDCFVPDDSIGGFDFFLRYVGTSLVVMFFNQYHVCLLHCDNWLWRNKLEVFDPSWLERWFIG